MTATTTKGRRPPEKTEAERDQEQWQRIEAARAGERADRAQARATWTPSTIAQVERQLEAVLGPGWAERARVRREVEARKRAAGGGA